VGFATECRIEHGAARSINAYRNPLPVIERSQTVIHAQPYRAGQARFPAGECRKAKAVRLTKCGSWLTWKLIGSSRDLSPPCMTNVSPVSVHFKPAEPEQAGNPMRSYLDLGSDHSRPAPGCSLRLEHHSPLRLTR
jgi:hypothetical protein